MRPAASYRSYFRRDDGRGSGGGGDGSGGRNSGGGGSGGGGSGGSGRRGRALGREEAEESLAGRGRINSSSPHHTSSPPSIEDAKSAFSTFLFLVFGREEA